MMKIRLKQISDNEIEILVGSQRSVVNIKPQPEETVTATNSSELERNVAEGLRKFLADGQRRTTRECWEHFRATVPEVEMLNWNRIRKIAGVLIETRGGKWWWFIHQPEAARSVACY